MELRENEIYTREETQKILKISSSTMIRLIKRGEIRAGRVGGQYRVLGKEILQIVRPEHANGANGRMGAKPKSEAQRG